MINAEVCWRCDNPSTIMMEHHEGGYMFICQKCYTEEYERDLESDN